MQQINELFQMNVVFPFSVEQMCCEVNDKKIEKSLFIFIPKLTEWNARKNALWNAPITSHQKILIDR